MVNDPQATLTPRSGRRIPDRRNPYDLLREAIRDGSLVPGSPLVEMQVARQYGVSRTPVREALTRLEQDGLVQRSDRGLVVKQRSPEEILDIYEIRIAIESLCARYAAERHNRLDRLRMTRLLNRASTVGEEDYAAYNDEFHRSIWAATHNEPLVGVLERLSSHLTRYPATTLRSPGRWPEAMKEHTLLVELVVARQSDAAAAVAADHFTKARDLRLKIYEEEID